MDTFVIQFVCCCPSFVPPLPPLFKEGFVGILLRCFGDLYAPPPQLALSIKQFQIFGGILFGIHIQVLWHINNINGCDNETTGTSVYYTLSSSSFEYYCSPLPLFACHVSVGRWRGGVSTRNKNKHLFIYLFIYYFLIMKETGC